MLPVPGTDYEISTMAESMYKMQRWNNLIAVSKLLAAPIVPVNALALAKYNVSFSSYHHHFKIFINWFTIFALNSVLRFHICFLIMYFPFSFSFYSIWEIELCFYCLIRRGHTTATLMMTHGMIRNAILETTRLWNVFKSMINRFWFTAYRKRRRSCKIAKTFSTNA